MYDIYMKDILEAIEEYKLSTTEEDE